VYEWKPTAARPQGRPKLRSEKWYQEWSKRNEIKWLANLHPGQKQMEKNSWEGQHVQYMKL
jgi:hypothetical protein